MPGHARRASSTSRTSGARPCASARQHATGRRAGPGDRRVARAESGPTTTTASTTTGIDSRTGDGSTSSTASVERDLHDLAGRALPGHGAQAPARRRPASRPWRTPRCTSPSTPPGQRRVEELRPVVRRDSRGQRTARRRVRGRPGSTATRSTPSSRSRDDQRQRPATTRRPSRSPSRNGPVPSRHTRKPRIASARQGATHHHRDRFTPSPSGPGDNCSAVVVTSRSASRAGAARPRAAAGAASGPPSHRRSAAASACGSPGADQQPGLVLPVAVAQRLRHPADVGRRRPGSPRAKASVTTMPYVSAREGSTSRSAAAYARSRAVPDEGTGERDPLTEAVARGTGHQLGGERRSHLPAADAERSATAGRSTSPARRAARRDPCPGVTAATHSSSTAARSCRRRARGRDAGLHRHGLRWAAARRR